MDWKTFFLTLSAVCLAELADKTQLVNLNLSAQSGKTGSVLLGSICAYLVVTTLTVLMGSVMAKYIKPAVVKYFAASLFILLGSLMFAGKL